MLLQARQPQLIIVVVSPFISKFKTGHAKSVTLFIDRFFKKIFVRNFLVIGGAAASAKIIHILSPFGAEF